MKNIESNRTNERGSAGTKFLIILVLVVLAANAGYNYIPVAYQGANFRQEMDTAVVKGLAASGAMRPVDVVKAHITKAAADNNVPSDALIEITPGPNFVQAHVAYKKQVDILPFGLYKYTYDFNYTAVPQGYLLKE
ncbi:MAG TPA: hypothetical protein VNK26_06350 [Pyrinomonadaceae bacterium]|jgi:hypothetical protein|nr:hypothetical protein [Pyrinomonadaceae bacterium]